MSKYFIIGVEKTIKSDIYVEVPDDCDIKQLVYNHRYEHVIEKLIEDQDDCYLFDDFNADIGTSGEFEEISKEQFEEYANLKIECSDDYPKL